MAITREKVIEFLDSLGDPVDWDGWTLEQIKDEVIRGDNYDGMNLWQSVVDYCEGP